MHIKCSLEHLYSILQFLIFQLIELNMTSITYLCFMFNSELEINYYVFILLTKNKNATSVYYPAPIVLDRL